jgi:DeoR/GlpR family transcriptional regulator of sugar metabolism
MISIVIELYSTGANHIETLEEKFKVSKKTIYRDLDQLEPMLIKMSKGTYGLSTVVQRTLSKSIRLA